VTGGRTRDDDEVINLAGSDLAGAWGMDRESSGSLILTQDAFEESATSIEAKFSSSNPKRERGRVVFVYAFKIARFHCVSGNAQKNQYFAAQRVAIR
jgi:hypothetical protein